MCMFFYFNKPRLLLPQKFSELYTYVHFLIVLVIRTVLNEFIFENFKIITVAAKKLPKKCVKT